MGSFKENLMVRSFLPLLVFVFCFNCKEKDPQPTSADAIIQHAIEVAGGDLFDQSDINFDFRDIHFRAYRNNGVFQLERHFKDSLSGITDVLKNSGFERFRDNENISLVDSLVSLYSASVNSVHYFSVLPYGLDDEAVRKTYLGTKEIKNKDYHKIKITFSAEGGGEDFDDEYIYWIQKDNATLDYLAYSFKEEDGSLGFRFREAYNARQVNGLRFLDYNNYKPTTSGVALEELDDLFLKDKLELLSKIELKNIEVKVLN